MNKAISKTLIPMAVTVLAASGLSVGLKGAGWARTHLSLIETSLSETQEFKSAITRAQALWTSCGPTDTSFLE